MSESPSMPQAPPRNFNNRHVDYSEEPVTEKSKDRKWLKRSAAVLMGYLAFVGIDNYAYYYHTINVDADDGSMISDIDGCDEFPKIEYSKLAFGPQLETGFTTKQVEDTIQVEEDQSRKSSAATKFKPMKFNAPDFVRDWYGIRKNELFSFESAYTGLDVHIYSDSEENPFKTNDIDKTKQQIDTLMNSSLSEDVNFGHVTVQGYAECLRERFVDIDGPRELENERLNIYIPSKPGVCVVNGVVQEFPRDSTYDDFCDSIAYTYKDVRARAWPFYEFKESWMVLMSYHDNPTEVDSQLSRLLIHEPTHYFMQAAGMPFQYHPNERLGDHIEKETIKQLYPDGIPVSLEYKDG